MAGKTLFETHCPPTAASLACDFAQTLSATLERKEEVARSSAVQLLGDLLLTGHLGEPEPGASGAQRAREAQFEAFRERLRAWMADPDGVRKQIDQLALDRIGFGFGFRPGHPESGASPVDDSVSPHALQRNAKTQPHTPKPVRIKPFTRGIVSQGK